MKIAIIGSRGIDSNYSGIEKGLREICPRLAKRGHEIYVFSQRNNRKSNTSDSYNGVYTIQVPSLKGKHIETLSRSALSTLISFTKGFDIINFRAEGSAIFCILCKLAGKRCVVTVHGLDWRRAKWSAFARFSLRIAEKIAVRFADKIVVVSKSLQKYFNDTYGRESVYIPNGIEPKKRTNACEYIGTLGLTKDEYILSASRLVPEKGCHKLIEAFNGIQTNKKLVIAGGARYESSYINKLKSMADSNKVIFAGHVTGVLLEELFSNAYLFVLPSDIEGLSNALLEALGYEKCALVSDIPENLEVLEDYGHSFKAGDTQDLRNKLKDLLENEKLVRDTECRLKSFIKEKYDWNLIAKKYEDVYMALISQ